MFLSDFDYDLPEGQIARHPPARRRDSRLLFVGDQLRDCRFAELTALLQENDLLVLNDTRVIPARLAARKVSGGRVEILVERLLSEFDILAHVRASKPPFAGSLLKLAADCEAEVLERQHGLYVLRFSQPVQAYLDSHGEIPLPPYLGRAAETEDRDRYQTIYARQPGAVAAPTAGLHFDREMLHELAASGIASAYITLHVGAGTFQSLRNERVTDNRLHSERVVVDEGLCDAVARTRSAGGKVIAVGTTSVRALEAAAIGGELAPCNTETDLFIYPGYEFQVVDAMLTNFHLPKSSLLMLVSAFAGKERTLLAYRHAVSSGYRFFSYGDAMLVYPATT